MIKLVILTIISLLFFSACSVKEYRLFQQENSEQISQSQELNITYSSKIVPNDILKIDIYNRTTLLVNQFFDKCFTNRGNIVISHIFNKFRQEKGITSAGIILNKVKLTKNQGYDYGDYYKEI